MTQIHKVAATALAAIALASGNAMASGSVDVYYADWGDYGDGFGVEGSFVIADSVRLFGELRSVEDSDLNAELDITRFGAGFLIPMNDQFTLEVGGSLQNWELSSQTFFGNFSVDDDVIGLHGIATVDVAENFHVRGSVEYLMFDEADDETGVIGFRGTFDLTPVFSVFAGVDLFTNDDVVDEDLLRLGASFNF